MTRDMQSSPPVHDTPGHTATVESEPDGDGLGTLHRWTCSCPARGRWVTRRWQAVEDAATSEEWEDGSPQSAVPEVVLNDMTSRRVMTR